MITVYVLRASVGGKRYVGITDNLVRRLEEHRRAHSTVGKLLGEFTVLLTEPYATYAEARKREKYLKSGRGGSGWTANFCGSAAEKTLASATGLALCDPPFVRAVA